MRFFAFLLPLIALVSVHAQVPIPQTPPGFALGAPAGAPIVLEAFYDLMCPDSAASWPTIQQVISHYGKNLNFLLHTFPLPYHTNSFFANQGAFVVGASNVSNVVAWTTAVFNNQASFSNAATADMTINEVISAFGDLAAKSGIIDKATFIAGINNDDINWAQRVAWKYGCTRGVAGTPTFLINGVQVAASASWALSDWESVLDPLVPKSERRHIGEHRSHGHHGHHGHHNKKSVFTEMAPPTCPSGEPICQYLPGKYECCLPGEGCIPNVGCRC